MLLGEKWEQIPARHASNMAEPEWASDYVREQGDMWAHVPGSATFLRRWWNVEPVRAWLGRIEKMWIELHGLAPGDERSRLVRQVMELESEETIRIVASEVDPECGVRVIRRRKPRVTPPALVVAPVVE
jgi:hypothetical protein